MRIDGVDVEEFADGEHEGKNIGGIDGDSLLLVGGNRTGKTLTFNAILYNLLGARETVGLSTGRGNSVELGFTDGSRFYRGEAGTTFDDGVDQYSGDAAKDEFAKKLADAALVKNHFVHSHIGKLPLDNLSGGNLVSLMRKVTNLEIEQQIQRYERALAQLEELTVETDDERRRLSEDLSEVERQIEEVESQVEKHENLLERAESGELETIRGQLLADEELEQELEELFNRRDGIRKQLRKLHRQKRKQENYAEEVNRVIAEAVNDFVCPACDRRISTEKAENRLRQGFCPYCGRDHSLSEVKESIEEKIDKSDELVEELERQIEELNEERDEVDNRIEAIQEERPELVSLDGFVKRKLDAYDYDIDAVREDVQEEIESQREKLEELTGERERIKEELDPLDNRLTQYQESLRHASERFETLTEDSFEEDIESFTSEWEKVYDEMSPNMSLEIDVMADGTIRLPGRNSIREYGGGNLSTAEIRLLNLSFVYALHQFAEQNGLIPWETFVLDEPFNNLDSEIRDEAAEFIQQAEPQFIVTSSDESLEQYFDQVEILEREPIQAQISDFT